MANGKDISTPCIYRIRIRGILEPHWSDWFYDFTIRHQPPDETTLTGRVVDQAALYGVLSKISELGFILLSVDMLQYDDQNWQTKYDRSTSCKQK